MSAPSSSSISLFTVGHSNLEPQDFVNLLATHSITVLCDVRSRPASHRHPQFNRDNLENLVAPERVRYQFAGEALGGRPGDPAAYYSDGRVNYTARRMAPDFRAALESVVQLAANQTVALMCAEEDPLQCHRFLMICPSLVERGVIPQHIRRGGALESQRSAEDRLLAVHGFSDVATGSLFAEGREAAVQDALLLQAKDYAFRASLDPSESY